MNSIFVFSKNKEYLGEIKEEGVSSSEIVKKTVGERPLYFKREKSEKKGNEVKRITYVEEIQPSDNNYFWAVTEELRSLGYKVFVFESEKRETALLLISAPLLNNERYEFFKNLLNVSGDEIHDLRKGLAADMKKYLDKA